MRLNRSLLPLWVCLLALLVLAQHSLAGVLPGIDVLAEQEFKPLKGHRIGLITNHTGRSTTGASTIDMLFRAPDVHLVALFSPEHGIRGEADEKLLSSVDRGTGLPIHSLYGATCRPTKEMLRGVDVLVFDIQDIGTRFYTYIGTLSLAMRAAKEAGIPFIVLDRPNPIDGLTVAGAVPAARTSADLTGCSQITSIHPIPTRHGMTIGELARLFNAEYGIGCDLTVIPMRGWQRDMYYDQTGLSWVNPSPNMRNLTAAILYPGLGILETANVSVGRGTASPFEQYGAPWIDAEALLRNLAARPLAGVTFTTCRFVPTGAGHPYRGRICNGVRITSIDRSKIDPVLAGLHLLQALYQAQPEKFRRDPGFAVEVGDGSVWEQLTKLNKTPEDVLAGWREADDQFRRVRERYLMY